MRKFAFGWKTQHQLESRRGRGTYQKRTKYDVAKDRLCSAPFVSMVQAAYLRNGNETTVLRSIDGSRLRGVFLQG
jgi:hypothetical protein